MKEHGIDTPDFELAYTFDDKKWNVTYSILPLRSSESKEVHATLAWVNDFVQGVYVPLKEEKWEEFTVLTVEDDKVKRATFPWSSLREPGIGALLSILARDRGFLPLEEARQDINYKAVFLMGASQIAVLNAKIGYVMLVSVCAI